MARISLRYFLKNLLVISSLFVASCARGDNAGSPFRIVGLNGEKRQIKTRTPELNARILESQGKPIQQQESSQVQLQPQSLQPQPQSSQPQPRQTIQQYTASPNADFGAATQTANSLQSPQEQGAPSYNLVKNDPVAPQQTEIRQPNLTMSAGAVEEKDQEIQYDLSDSVKESGGARNAHGKKMKLRVGQNSSAKDESAVEEKEVAVSHSKKKGIFVQTGSFSSEENAKQDLAKTQKFHQGRIEEANSGSKTIYRVLLGPFESEKKAKDAVRKIKSSGHDAIVVKNK